MLRSYVDSMVVATVSCVFLPIQMDHCMKGKGKIQRDNGDYRMMEFSSDVQQIGCFISSGDFDYEKRRCRLSLLNQCGLTFLFEGYQVRCKSSMTFFFRG